MSTASSAPSTFPTPIQSLVRRRALTLTLVFIGAALGLAYGYVQPRTFTAESRLAVGAGELSAFAIPGFPLASRELASNYSRWVQNIAKDPSQAPPGVTDIRASPIPDSNIVRIEVEADAPEHAKNAVNDISQKLVTEVNEGRSVQQITAARNKFNELSTSAARAEAQRQVTQTRLATAAAGGRGNVLRLTETLAQLNDQTARLQLERDAQSELYRRLIGQSSSGSDLRIIQDPTVTGDNHSSNVQRFGLLGMGAGALLSLLIAVLLDRRAARRAAKPDRRKNPSSSDPRWSSP